MLDSLYGKSYKNRYAMAPKPNKAREISRAEWIDYLKTQVENLNKILSQYDNKLDYHEKRKLINKIADIVNVLNASIKSGLKNEMIKYFYKNVPLPEIGSGSDFDETFYKIAGYQYIVGINELINYMNETHEDNPAK
jgi:hypothetical protein